MKEERERKLSTWLVILVVIAMNIYSQLPIEGALAKIIKGVRSLRLSNDERCATAGAISQRRYQLGWQVMQKLFQRMCKPLATLQTKGAYLFGSRKDPMGRAGIPNCKRCC